MKKTLIKILLASSVIISIVFSLVVVYATNDNVALTEVVNGSDISTGKCGDNASWIFDSETGELTITGTGDMYDYGQGEAPWYSERLNIKKVVVHNGITRIGVHSFSSYWHLYEIQLSSGLISIGQMAFFGCAITEIVIPQSVTTIEPAAFANCDSLKSVSISRSVSSIYDSSFMYCYNLEEIIVDEQSPYFCSTGYALYTKDRKQLIKYAPKKCGASVEISSGVEVIYGYAFDQCNELKKVIMPLSVKKISWGAFQYCDSFTDVYYEGDEEQWEEIKFGYIHEFEDKNINYNCFDTVAEGIIKESIGWRINKSGSLMIWGHGKMPDFTYDTIAWNKYVSDIKYVYISSGITNVGDYAFYNHTNLKYADFGKNCTNIGDYAFSGCKDLTEIRLPNVLVSLGEGSFSRTGIKKIIIPEKLEEVGHFAFENCDNLTAIQFDGNPPKVFYTDCADNGNVVIYYDRNCVFWFDIIEDDKWNGFEITHTDKVSSLGSVNSTYNNNYMIRIMDSSRNSIPYASVTLGDITAASDYNGIVYFEKPSQVTTLEVTKEGYNTYIAENYIPVSGYTDYIIICTEPSTIEGISVNGKSISSSVYVLNSNSKETVSINVKGHSTQKIKKYELYQGTRLIKSISTTENACTFNVASKSFEEGETVFVKMYVKDGSSVISPLNIDVVNIANISEAQILDELSNMELTINPANIGEIKIPLQFKTDTNNAFYTVIEGKTIMVGINLNLNNFLSNFEGFSPAYIRNKIQKAVDDSLKSYKKTSPGIGYKLSGYIEIEYLGDGKYYVKTNYVKLAVSAKLSFNAQASFFQMVGIYFKASLDGDGSLALTISRYSPETDFSVKDATVGINNKLGIEGGGYIIAGLGSAALYGSADMGFDLGLVPQTEFKKVYINGNVGVKWSVFWGLWGDSLPFWKGKIFEWSKEGSINLLDIDDLGYSSVSDIAKGGINPRLYLEKRSGWMPETVELMDVGESSDSLLQSDVYNDIQPKIVKTSTNTVMVWLDDDANQDADNFKALYYSLLTDGNWSAPQKVNDNVRMDCEFDVISYNDTVYIIYTEQDYSLYDVASLFIEDTNGNMVINEDKLRQITEYVEIHIATLKNGNISSDITLTDNYLCETLPSLSVQNDKLTAMWSVSEGFGFKDGSDSIYKSTLLSDGNWSKEEVLTNKQSNIISTDAGMLNGKYMYAYIADADSDASTTDEYILVIKDENGGVYVLDSGMISSPEFAVINGKEVFSWLKDMKLRYITKEDSMPYTYDFIIDGDYEVVDDGENTLIIYDSAKKDGKGGISAVYINDDGTEVSPFVIVDNGGYIDSFAAFADDNKIGIAYTETYTDTEEDELIFRTNFRYVHMDLGYMLTLDRADVTFDGDKAFVNMTCSNNGFEKINGVRISVYDSANNVIYTDTYDCVLKSGESRECEIFFDIPEVLSETGYTVSVMPLDADELSEDDNSKSISLISKDIGIYGEQKVIAQRLYAELTVQNLGNTIASGRVNVYSGEKSDTPTESFDYEELLPGESRVYLIDVSSSVSGSGIRVFEAVTEDDISVLNDTFTLELFEINSADLPSIEEEIVPDPVISANSFDYDLPFGAGVEIGVTSGMEMFSYIDGLILDEDYFVYDDSIIISDTYIRGLGCGTHTLRLVFIHNEKEIYKNVSLYVYNSTPVGIGGSVAIVGDTVAFGVLKADVSELTPFGAEVAYYWYIDGECVQTGDTYTVSPDDVGKTVYLEARGADEHPGIIGTEVVISKSNQAAPHSPVIKSLTCTSVTFVGEDNTEYSMDMTNWQDDASFTGLTFNEEYTFYSRKKALEYAYASDVSKGKVIVMDGTHNFLTETVNPTCVNIGYTKCTCTDCGHIEKKNSKPSLGHSWSEWYRTDDPTCCRSGHNERICSVCERTEQEYLSPIGHNETNSYWQVSIEPECKTEGLKELICINEGTTVEVESIPATGVCIYQSEVIPSTCVEEGYTINFCTMCGDEYITDNTPLSDHIPGPEHQEDNYRVVRCEYCREIISSEVIDIPSGGGGGGSSGSTKTKTVRVEIFSDLVRLRAEDYEYDDYTGRVIVALYDSGDKLKQIVTYDAQSRIETEFTEEASYSYAKIMWIYDIVSMKPLCESQVVYNN